MVGAPMIIPVNETQLPSQNFDQKIAVAAGGLKKACVNLTELVGDEVKHRIDLPLVGVDLCEISHAFARLDLIALNIHERAPGQISFGMS
jgi:hypothetical protein